MTLNGKKVLVTGGTGFIGSRLVERLVVEQRAQVRVLVRHFAKVPRIARFSIELVPGDVSNPLSVEKAVQGCDVVFHCAYDFASDAEEQKRSGVSGTRNVCDAIIKSRTGRMVHLSTFAVYAPTVDGNLTELSPWPRTKNSYVAIKRKAERLVLSFHEKHELPVVVLQPTLVYGPFSPHWTVGTIQNLKTGLVPLTHGGEGYCNLVFIDDLIEAMLLAATQPDVSGETFLVSGKEPITWGAYYRRFEDMLGTQATTERSENEILQMIKDRNRANQPTARLVNLVRQPSVYPYLLSLPGIRGSLRLLKKGLPPSQWNSLKSHFVSGSTPVSRNNGASAKMIHLPDKSLLALYASKTRVSIDKAKHRLGYEPKVAFDEGMDLTERFVRWAGLG